MKVKATEYYARPGSLPDTERRSLSGRGVLLLLLILLVCCALASFALGRYPVSLKALGGILFSRLPFTHIPKFWSDAQQAAVINVRLPRILTAVLVGASLSAAGAAYQGVFQNPIAAPDILGASAGAGFGAALAIFIGLSGAGITALAFVMSLITVFLVFLIGNRVKGEKTLGLVLAGIMVSSLFQAGTSFIKLVADPSNKLPAITFWLMGSLAGVDRDDLLFVIWPVLAGSIPLLLLSWRINVITLGDAEARALGIDAGRVRLLAVLSATLLTAAAVSVSGMIGWVGLVIPHMMRRLVGSDFRVLLPASVLGGGIFMLIVDNISRNAAAMEIPVGILTAVIGAPFFLLLITRRDSRNA